MPCLTKKISIDPNSTTKKKEGEMEDPDLWYKIVIFLGEDPRETNPGFLDIDERTMRAKVVAFVIPYGSGSTGYYRGIPIVTWEEPNSDSLRATQYLKLYEVTEAESAFMVGWPYRMPGLSEAGIFRMLPLTAETLSGRGFSAFVHIRLYGKIPEQRKKKVRRKTPAATLRT